MDGGWASVYSIFQAVDFKPRHRSFLSWPVISQCPRCLPGSRSTESDRNHRRINTQNREAVTKDFSSCACARQTPGNIWRNMMWSEHNSTVPSAHTHASPSFAPSCLLPSVHRHLRSSDLYKIALKTRPRHPSASVRYLRGNHYVGKKVARVAVLDHGAARVRQRDLGRSLFGGICAGLRAAFALAPPSKEQPTTHGRDVRRPV